MASSVSGPECAGGIVEHRVHHAPGQLVGHHRLLHDPAGDQEQRRPGQYRARIARRAQLREQLVGANDRSGHEVREEALEDRDVAEGGGRRVAAVHVHHVRDRLEGEERDADRQHDLEQGSGAPSPTPSSASSVEATKNSRYLKTASSPRSNTSAATSAGLRSFSDGRARDHLCREGVHDARADQQQHPAWIDPAVEEVRHGEDERAPEPRMRHESQERTNTTTKKAANSIVRTQPGGHSDSDLDSFRRQRG